MSCKDKAGLLASNQESGDVPSAVDASPNGDVLGVKSRPICGCQGSKFRCWPTRARHEVVSATVIAMKSEKTLKSELTDEAFLSYEVTGQGILISIRTCREQGHEANRCGSLESLQGCQKAQIGISRDKHGRIGAGRLEMIDFDLQFLVTIVMRWHGDDGWQTRIHREALTVLVSWC
jgi:hypothetical protein